jgi:hypothetical protein
MSAVTRRMSSAARAALVEKPPTSTSMSVVPSVALEKRPFSSSGPLTSARYLSSMSEKSTDGAGSVSSSSVPVC